jgi:hypothetical protein
MMRAGTDSGNPLGAIVAVIVAILILALVGIVPALADAAPARERVILCVKTGAEGRGMVRDIALGKSCRAHERPVKPNHATRAQPTAPRDLEASRGD